MLADAALSALLSCAKATQNRPLDMLNMLALDGSAMGDCCSTMISLFMVWLPAAAVARPAFLQPVLCASAFDVISKTCQLAA